MSRLVFVDQGVGSLTQELVMAAAESFESVRYYNAIPNLPQKNVRLVQMPRNDNRSTRARLLAWSHYLAKSSWYALTEPENPLLFIVTNPPLSPMVGVMAKALRRQRYIVLFYDMYPEALERFRGISRSSIVSRVWRRLNLIAIQHADKVITISPHLAKTLDQYIKPNDVQARVMIVPTWVDTHRIHPMPKSDNWFAKKYGQVDKLTILYGGNLGLVHDLTMLPEIAFQLREYPDVHFVVVGDGPGRDSLELACSRHKLQNITLLPLQPEDVVPFSLATADIGVVALANGAEGISMPSKTYYMMAAGSALLGLSSTHSDLSNIIREHSCGINVVPGDVDGAVRAILQLREQPAVFNRYRINARQAAERYYSRDVCIPQLLQTIRAFL